ncbi:MAG: hypothetical protein H6Q42_1221 [Deltaproteobacteria bacterium]|nr:hypothetical protein [Deltaproteobacteria bacterium]
MKFGKKINPIVLFVALVFAVTAMMGARFLAPASAATLSAAEAETLTFMREEEKMAHDVYLVMYEKWGAAIFANILASEQRHMDTMLKMLTKYGLPDPTAEMGTGEFANEDLQELYNELVARGSVSLNEAFQVGVDIENTDIIDLQNALAGTTRRDLRTANINLLEGSYNHLQAFEKALAAQGQ